MCCLRFALSCLNDVFDDVFEHGELVVVDVALCRDEHGLCQGVNRLVVEGLLRAHVHVPHGQIRSLRDGDVRFGNSQAVKKRERVANCPLSTASWSVCGQRCKYEERPK